MVTDFLHYIDILANAINAWFNKPTSWPSGYLYFAASRFFVTVCLWFLVGASIKLAKARPRMWYGWLMLAPSLAALVYYGVKLWVTPTILSPGTYGVIYVNFSVGGVIFLACVLISRLTYAMKDNDKLERKNKRYKRWWRIWNDRHKAGQNES